MVTRIAAIALGALALATSTAAAASPHVTLTPAAGAAGKRIVVRGSGWAQIEFCKPRVILAVDDVVFARALLDGHGRFALRWRIPGFARGLHRVFATQRCESGKDGSPLPVTRHVDLRVTG
ncbi:MAG: hypothetical protein QOH00_1180 [Gaiellales bacterium]|jgi:hypothetical protein|nr:hypothetical protein [Gaiellales bacterium]